MTDATDPRVRLGQRLKEAKVAIGARFVAQMLLTYADWHTGASARPGLPTIAEITGMDIRHVRRYVRSLEEQQIIFGVRRPGNSTWYAINLGSTATNSTNTPGHQEPSPSPVDNEAPSIHTPGATSPGELSTPRAPHATPGATRPGHQEPPHPGRHMPPHPGRHMPPDPIDLNDHAVRATPDHLTGEALTAFGRLLPPEAALALDRTALDRVCVHLAAAGWTRKGLATALDGRRRSLSQARGAGLAMSVLRELARIGPPATGRLSSSTAAAVPRCPHGAPLAARDGSGCPRCAEDVHGPPGAVRGQVAS